MQQLVVEVKLASPTSDSPNGGWGNYSTCELGAGSEPGPGWRGAARCARGVTAFADAPGLRYLLEGRGGCDGRACRCYFPHYGAACEWPRRRTTRRPRVIAAPVLQIPRHFGGIGIAVRADDPEAGLPSGV